MSENDQTAYTDRGVEFPALYVEWLEDLVFDHMLVGIRELQAKELEALSAHSTRQGLRAGYHQWATDELMKFGVVSLYHQWERDLKGLWEQSFSETPVATRSPKPKDQVSRLLDGIEDELGAADWSLTFSADDRRLLHECRELTNLIKHDPGAGYDEIAAKYPVHFEADEGPAEHRFRITPDQLRRLFTGMKAFWEHLEPRWPPR